MKGKGLIFETKQAWKRYRTQPLRRPAQFFRSGFARLRLRRQIVITAEKYETFVIHPDVATSIRAFCEACGEEIDCLTLEQAVKLTGLGARAIFRLVEAGNIHCYEKNDGHLLLCPKSISSFVKL